jgi:transposase
MAANHPQWALKYKKKGTELRCIRGRYYLYEVSSKWDKEKKRARKITGKCLGSITPDGFKPSKSTLAGLGKEFKPSVKNFGAYAFFKNEFQSWLDPLRDIFPRHWRQLFCLACIRLFHRVPIKRMPVIFDNSYFSEEFLGLPFSDKTISKLLNETGKNQSAIDKFLKSFIKEEHIALIDATPIFSQSKNIYEARLGYNNKKQWDPQLNLLYLYDHKLAMPLYFRLTQGDLREIKTLELTLEAVGFQNAIIIGDKGFSSALNEEILTQKKLKYILPLKRVSSKIDYAGFSPINKNDMNGYFKFKERYIWFKKSKNNNKTVITYLDEQLKVVEERDYLDRVDKYPEEYNIGKFHENNYKMGTLALITNLNEYSADELYHTYKSRCEVEQLFDVFKNMLDADKTYMQNIESVKGWLFINHLAIIAYYRIYKLLKEEKLLNKISVEDLIVHLNHINKIKINNKWWLQEIPNKTKKLLEKCNLNLHIT